MAARNMLRIEINIHDVRQFGYLQGSVEETPFQNTNKFPKHVYISAD